MSGSAIIMMIIAIGIVWGGLVVAIVQLARHPEDEPSLPPEST